MFTDYQCARSECGKDEQDIIFFLSFLPLFKVRIRNHRNRYGGQQDQAHVENAKSIENEQRLDDPFHL
jgi:hypothetical protein